MESFGVTCCSEEQAIFLADYTLYIGTCLLLWHSRILSPLKLFTVFLHELGHALASWLICNRVLGIEVNSNQGGLTTYTTIRPKLSAHVVLPAGYLGSAIWGGIIVVCCVHPVSLHGVTIALIGFLFVALCFSLCGENKESQGDWTLTLLSVGMLAVLGGMLYACYFTQWEYRDLMLEKVMLLVGIMNTLFATYDIWEDCVSRTVERSDAYRYAELVGYATPVCVGVVWLLVSVVFALVALWAALLCSPEGPPVKSMEDLSSFSVLSILVPAGVFLAAAGFRLTCSRTYEGKLATVTKRGLQRKPLAGSTPISERSRSLGGDAILQEDGSYLMTTGSHAAPDSRSFEHSILEQDEETDLAEEEGSEEAESVSSEGGCCP